MTVRDDTTGHDAPFSSTGGGGGAVESVNGQTGAVVLDAADVGAVGSLNLTSPDGTVWAPAIGDDGTVTYSDASIVVSDTFDRADETPLSVADTGQAWTALAGTGLSVVSNECGKVTSGTQASVIDSGLADKRVSYTQGQEPGSGTLDRLLLRVTDANNHLHLRMTTGHLYEVIGGVATLIGTLSDPPVSGTEVEVVLDGADVAVLLDGVENIAVTTTVLAGDSDGFQMADAFTRVDDFKVRSL